MRRIFPTCSLVFVLLLQTGALEAALQSVEDLYQAKEFVAFAERYLESNLLDKAEEEYWKAVALDFANIEARLGLGEVYRRKEMYERAIESFQIVLNQQPENVDILYQISLLYYDNHQYELSRMAADKAFQMDPNLTKAENQIRLSEDKLREQQLELDELNRKELEALQRFRQVQETKESAFIGAFIPGWRHIQTAESKTMWTGYLILGSTAGLFFGGRFLRSSGQKAYTEAAVATNIDLYNNRADLGKRRYRAGNYMMDAALGMLALNLIDSIFLKGKIFGGRTRVKPSLPEREKHKLY